MQGAEGASSPVEADVVDSITLLEEPRGSLPITEALSAETGQELLVHSLSVVGDTILLAMLACFVWMGIRHKMAAFPALGVCVNMSWEMVYAFSGAGSDAFQQAMFWGWLGVDSLVMWQLLRFGIQQSKWELLMRSYYRGVLIAAVVVATAGQYVFLQAFPSSGLFVSAYVTNFIMSASFVFYFLQWPHPERHSLLGAWLKFLGTGTISVANWIVFSTQPGPLTGATLFVAYLITLVTLMDIGYVVLLHLARRRLSAAPRPVEA